MSLNEDMRSWAEIDLNTLINNFKVYLQNMPNKHEIMAVVKADAYGHGDIEVSRTLQSVGVSDFAVSNIDEAIRLRENGINGQILILGYTPVNRADELEEFDITQCLLSEEYADLLAEKTTRVKCQLALDTGMRRIGIDASDPNHCETVIRRNADVFQLNGVFTHLCDADTDKADSVAFTKKQIALFEEVVERIEDLHLPYCHCLNSAGGLWHHSSVSCFTRLGIILYGLKPDNYNELPSDIKPVLTWKSVVSMVKSVKQGDWIGYGRSFYVDHPMRVATIPTGYADGYNRHLSNRGYVIIRGKRANIVGRVCMDQFMVDVSNIEGISIGEEVILIGHDGNNAMTADEMAEIIGTIGYEVICDIGKRVPRVYIS